MKHRNLAMTFGMACLAALPAFAQTNTGSNTPTITLPTPPRTMASMPVAETAGADSTYQGNVQSNQQQTFTLSVPWTYSGSGSPAAQAPALSRPLPARRATTTAPASTSSEIY